MADTIDSNIVQRVIDSMPQQNPDNHIINTLTIELSGQHGGVDVTAHMDVPTQVGCIVTLTQLTRTWTVR